MDILRLQLSPGFGCFLSSISLSFQLFSTLLNESLDDDNIKSSSYESADCMFPAFGTFRSISFLFGRKFRSHAKSFLYVSE